MVFQNIVISINAAIAIVSWNMKIIFLCTQHFENMYLTVSQSIGHVINTIYIYLKN